MCTSRSSFFSFLKNEKFFQQFHISLRLLFCVFALIGFLRWPTRDTLQTKKKPPKQKRKHANKTETTQIKKKPRKQKRKRKQKKRNHAHKTETTQTKQKPRTQNRNHAHKTETTQTKQKPRKQKRNSFPEPLRGFCVVSLTKVIAVGESVSRQACCDRPYEACSMKSLEDVLLTLWVRIDH